MNEERKIDYYLFEDIYNVDESDSNKIAIHFKDTSYSFLEVRKSVDYYCHYLKSKGVKKDDHVAIISMNSFNDLIAFYSVIKLGAVAVLFNYMARHDTLVKLVKHTDCKYLCYGSYNASIKDEKELDALLEETKIKKENAFSIRNKELNFKEILSKEIEIPSFTSPYSREEDSKRTSYIIFTTGTTADPKAAMLSQYSLMNIIYLNFAKLDPIFPQKFMCLLPMFHCFGLLVVNAYLAFKRTVYLNSLEDKVQIYKEFIKHKCGDYASVAIIFDKLAKAPFWWLHKGRFVRHCIVGGGFTSEQEFKFLERKYGKGKFMNGYGQTECSPMISLVYPDSPKEKQMTTVGTVMKDIEIAFMDPGSKKILPKGQVGEILIKGYNVFNGYYKMSKEKQPFDKDGYLHTGDLGYLDKDGYLVLNGRIKDTIIRYGENISPKEIEAELEKFPEFGHVRVLGFPSIDEGEYIIACVELKKKPPHFIEEKYFEEMHKTLPSVKIPSHIIYMKKFPLTASGKLDEIKLREICMTKLALYLDEEMLAIKTKKLMYKQNEKKRRK